MNIAFFANRESQMKNVWGVVCLYFIALPSDNINKQHNEHDQQTSPQNEFYLPHAKCEYKRNRTKAQ